MKYIVQYLRDSTRKRIGVVVAVNIENENKYAINYSLVNPPKVKYVHDGKTVLSKSDKFDYRIGTKLALAKVMLGEKMTKFGYETKRTISLTNQIEEFKLRAAKYFKDKQLVNL